jgi:hypothetical protein
MVGDGIAYEVLTRSRARGTTWARRRNPCIWMLAVDVLDGHAGGSESGRVSSPFVPKRIEFGRKNQSLGPWPGQALYWGTAADPFAGRDAGCMFRGRLRARTATHPPSFAIEKPCAHSVLRRNVISA